MSPLDACYLAAFISLVVGLLLAAASLTRRANQIHLVVTNHAGKLAELEKLAKTQLETPIAQHLVDAGIGFFATVGAKNLAEAGFNKQQQAQITLARGGFNLAGDRFAKGMGIDGLVGQLTGGGGPAPGGGGAPEMDIMGMAKNYIANWLGGQLGALNPGAAEVAQNVYPQLPR